MAETKQVMCDICGKIEVDTTDNLMDENWYLGNREEFCGECNK
jgi:hypothetical protein